MKWWNFLLLIIQLSILIYAKRSRHVRKSYRNGHRHFQNDYWDEENFRIVNGSKAKQNQFPWAAALLGTPCNKYTGQLDYSRGENYREKCCGASIISPKYLITAAHCFYVAAPLDDNRCKDYCDCDPVLKYDPKDLKVVPGLLSIDYQNNMGSWHNIEKLHSHPQFNKRTLCNDIGVIELADDNQIEFSRHPLIGAIEVWPNLIEEGTKATTCGWGDNCWQTNKDPNKRREDKSQFYHLKYINVVTSDFDTCSWDKMTYNKTYENVICAVAENRHLGSGDSGNGLFTMCGNNNNLIGVASTFHKCGHTQPGNVSSAYTRLSTFKDWIDEIMNNLDEPNNGIDYIPEEPVDEVYDNTEGENTDEGTNGDFDTGDTEPGDNETGDYYSGDYSTEDYHPLGDINWDYTSYHPYNWRPFNHWNYNYWSNGNNPYGPHKDPFNYGYWPCNSKPFNNGNNNGNNENDDGNENEINNRNNNGNTNRNYNENNNGNKNGNNKNKPCINGPYNSGKSMGLWQWIHMYPKLSTGKFPDNDDDNYIKHKSNLNFISNVNSNSNHNNNNNVNTNINHNHNSNSNFGYNKNGYHSLFWRKHSKPKVTDDGDNDNDDDHIKHKMNFNYNSNVNTNTNNNQNTNVNNNLNNNYQYGYNYGASHNLFMRKNNGLNKALDVDNKDDEDKK